MTSPVIQPIQSIAPSFSLEQVQAMIKQASADGYQAGFERVKEFLPVVEKPKTTLDLINEAFSKDEQAWLCNPSVLSCIDDFLIGYIDSEKLAALRNCFNSFREYYESKNRTHS